MDTFEMRGIITDVKAKGFVAEKDARRLCSSISDLLDAVRLLSDEMERALYEQEKKSNQ